ncbi:MAG: hypothetical protein ACI9FR_001118 [Cryomorphaceae bacterium]|jgi:hypothetical protein
MTHILHINDNNILIQSRTGSDSSQGYAWLKGDEVLFDTDQVNAPVKHCRVAPQEINSRYWQQCEQSAIPTNGAGMRHAADLIWSHLGALKSAHGLGEVVLVVPSHYQSSHLQLLLGIAKSLGLNVVSLLNKAALAVRDSAPQEGDFLHLDVQLHQTVASQVSVHNGLIKLGAVEVLQNIGIHSMQDALLKTMQSSFIQNDRFDPLHYAETEQQLFDQLGEVAAQIEGNAKASIAVQHQSRLYTTSLDVKAWSASLAHVIKPLLQAGSVSEHVYIDMNSAFGSNIPGGIQGAGVSVVNEPPRYSALLSEIKHTDGSAVAYTTEFSITLSDEASSVDSSNSQSYVSTVSSTGATHFLQAGIAVPIEHSEIIIEDNQLFLHTSAKGNADALLAAAKIFILNDESRQTFKPNDRIGSYFCEGVITVIQVV